MHMIKIILEQIWALALIKVAKQRLHIEAGFEKNVPSFIQWMLGPAHVKPSGNAQEKWSGRRNMRVAAQQEN